MCGVAGSIGLPFVDVDIVRQLMSDRGPDDFSLYARESIAVAHSRLAVIGRRSDQAKQPIVREGVYLFVNGFVSNHFEVSSMFGWSTSESDCSVILSLYLHDGIQSLHYLRGQFAGAIVDERTRKVLLFRDASGIAPLYYSFDDECLLFCSQGSWLERLRRKKAEPSVSRIDGIALEDWVACGYSTGPMTLLHGVRSVMPGEIVEVEANAHKILSHFSFLGQRRKPSGGLLAAELRLLVQQAVRRNLRADTNPWLLFSGGLDSTLILHCASAEGVNLKLLALRYPDEQNAVELAHAVKVAGHYDCELEIIDFSMPNESELRSLFVRRIDWPLDGGSLLPKIALADFCKNRGVKAVLGGSGADVLFGGYKRHVGRLSLYRDDVVGQAIAERRYYRDWIGKHGGDGDGPFRRMRDGEVSGGFGDPGFAYDLLELTQFHNPRLDSCFANAGVEYRPVFQDQDVVQFAAELPLDRKLTQSTTKALLREAFDGELPPEFLSVPKIPLRFSEMGPTKEWRSKVMRAWRDARGVPL